MNKNDTTRVPEHKCPKCDHLLDAVTDVGNSKPKPGDVTICLNCQKTLIITDDLTSRLPTAEEEMVLNMDPMILRIQLAMIKIKPDQVEELLKD